MLSDTEYTFMGCCGVKEIEGLSEAENSKEALQSLCLEGEQDGAPREGKSIWAAFMVFTAAGRGRYGANFKKYLKRHKLGKVIETDARVNPNTKNRLKVWVWAINHKALTKWWKKNRPSEKVLLDNSYTKW